MEKREVLFDIVRATAAFLATPVQFSFYSIIFIRKGNGVYHADFGTFPFAGPVLLFSTPMQQIYIEQADPIDMVMLQFHGDFYCIEYHRAEVSCNGLLFNNCYIEPAVHLAAQECAVFHQLLKDIEQELELAEVNETVIRAYLQIWL